MSDLVNSSPYGPRNEDDFLAEMNRLTAHHLAACDEYAKVWPDWHPATNVEQLPYLHVGTFKWIDFRTIGEHIKHERTLLSSATTSGTPSRIALDEKSSELQARSSLAILSDFVGETPRPLLVVDSARSLRMRGEVSARIAAAMSLRPLASDIYFLLATPEDPSSMKWDLLGKLLDEHDEFIVYGFTWILHTAWGAAAVPDEIRSRLAGKTICFVHSGGWKKLEAARVTREAFDEALLSGLSAESKVVDFYGLVEQVGVVYPLCEFGFRHTPVWADVIVRDSIELTPLSGEPGQLQLMNVLASGAPYHNVLTEDTGRIIRGECPCGRSGKRFELLGRLPKAEARGCANV
ncbi:MAG: hypothetical protein OEM99_14420 [Gammaproteobacteria bacterium]|nr:hypothetical protein [Gammaproteobacteria bacterium]